MQTIIPPIAAEPIITEPRRDALAALYDRNTDMTRGFAKMVEKAEPSFKGTAERFRALHARHADRLARLLADLHVEANPDGTLMGAVHKAVVSIRAFFDEIDEDVMDQVRSGEQSLLKAYDDAIAESETDRFVATLREMRTEVAAELAATAHLD